MNITHITPCSQIFTYSEKNIKFSVTTMTELKKVQPIYIQVRKCVHELVTEKVKWRRKYPRQNPILILIQCQVK